MRRNHLDGQLGKPLQLQFLFLSSLLALCNSFSAGAAPVSDPNASYMAQSGRKTQSILKNVKYTQLLVSSV